MAEETALNTPVEEEKDTDITVGDVANQYSTVADEERASETPEFSGYENPSGNIEALAPSQGEEYMTPETTVAGQLERLLDSGGALQQQAQVKARERASALGMMSSSSAIGAARRADVEALTPVAMQDAQTAATFKGQQQQAENAFKQIQVEAEVSGSLTQQKAEIQEESNKIARAWESTIKGLDTEAQAAMTNLQGEWQGKMETLKGDITRELQMQEIDSAVEQTIINQANDAMNNYQITVQNLLANESFLDNFAGNTEGMRAYFDELFVTVESSLKYTAKAAGVYDTLSPYIDELVEENQWA